MYPEYTYESNMEHNYLVILAEDGKDSYETRMMLENKVNGLLSVKIDYKENQKKWYYEVFHMKTLEEIYSLKKMNYQELKEMIYSICQVVENSRKYFLNCDFILFQPEFIFIDLKTGRYYYCYWPMERQEDCKSKMIQLFREIMKWLDYQDKEAVELAYEMERIVVQDNYNLEQWKEVIEKRSYAIVRTKRTQERELVNRTETDIDYKINKQKGGITNIVNRLKKTLSWILKLKDLI